MLLTVVHTPHRVSLVMTIGTTNEEYGRRQKSIHQVLLTKLKTSFQAQGGQQGELLRSFSCPRRSNKCDQEYEYQGAYFIALVVSVSPTQLDDTLLSQYEHAKAFRASVNSSNRLTLNQCQRTNTDCPARLSFQYIQYL